MRLPRRGRGVFPLFRETRVCSFFREKRNTGCGSQRLLRPRKGASHPAGRCPNLGSLFPPQAAVASVAKKAFHTARASARAKVFYKHRAGKPSPSSPAAMPPLPKGRGFGRAANFPSLPRAPPSGQTSPGRGKMSPLGDKKGNKLSSAARPVTYSPLPFTSRAKHGTV